MWFDFISGGPISGEHRLYSLMRKKPDSTIFKKFISKKFRK